MYDKWMLGGECSPFHLAKHLGVAAQCQISGYSGYKTSTLRGKGRISRELLQLERVSSAVNHSKYKRYDEFVLIS